MARRVQRILTLALILWVETGCGSAQPDLPARQIDPDLHEFITAFAADARRHGIEPASLDLIRSATIQSSIDPDETTGQNEQRVGYCETNVLESGRSKLVRGTGLHTGMETSTTFFRIVISRKLIDEDASGSQSALRAIMYHELTHCLLQKSHDLDNSGLMAETLENWRLTDPESASELIDGLFAPDYFSKLPGL